MLEPHQPTKDCAICGKPGDEYQVRHPKFGNLTGMIFPLCQDCALAYAKEGANLRPRMWWMH